MCLKQNHISLYITHILKLNVAAFLFSRVIIIKIKIPVRWNSCTKIVTENKHSELKLFKNTKQNKKTIRLVSL